MRSAVAAEEQSKTFTLRVEGRNVATYIVHRVGGKCLLICFISDFNFALYTRFYSLSQASAGSEFIEQQGPQQKSDEPDHV